MLQEIQKEDWKLNLSDAAQTLATRIVWCCADVWNFWTRSEAFSFWKVSPLHELLQHVLSCYSWLKIECLRTCSNFGYRNSLMLCLCVRLFGKIRDVQFLSFFFNFALRNSKRRLKIECLRYCSNFGYQNSLMLCLCVRLLGKIRDVQFLSFFFNFALRNSKRRLKIECLRYSSNFACQNSLMLCWCVKFLGKIWGVQFSKGFTSSWTAATCFSMLFLIENWMSQILLKLWLPE